MKKEKFKETMHDYSNLNEYYSYFGDIVYISSGYNKNDDYFMIIRRSKDMALVRISDDLRQKFLNKKNRDNVDTDLTALQSSLYWIVPTAFNFHVSDLLNDPSFPDRNELIKLKNNDIKHWNRIFVENILRDYKLDHTLLSSGMTFDEGIQAGYTITYTTAELVYGSPYSFSFEWVVGNHFFDVKIRRLNQIKVRRLQYFDIDDLVKVLKAVGYQNDVAAIEAIEEFSTIK